MNCMLVLPDSTLKVLFQKVAAYGSKIRVYSTAGVLYEGEINQDLVLDVSSISKDIVSLDVLIGETRFFIEKVGVKKPPIKAPIQPLPSLADKKAKYVAEFDSRIKERIIYAENISGRKE
jgi:hypothetical protein